MSWQMVVGVTHAMAAVVLPLGLYCLSRRNEQAALRKRQNARAIALFPALELWKHQVRALWEILDLAGGLDAEIRILKGERGRALAPACPEDEIWGALRDLPPEVALQLSTALARQRMLVGSLNSARWESHGEALSDVDSRILNELFRRELRPLEGHIAAAIEALSSAYPKLAPGQNPPLGMAGSS